MDSLISFGTDFFQILADATPPTENVVYSPFSLLCALTLVLFGSKGSTRSELSSVLFNANDVSNSSIAALSDAISSIANRNETSFNNFLFVDETFKLARDYRNSANKLVKTSVTAMNFSREPDKAINEINRRISEATHGLIKRVIDELSPESKLVLINALHFKNAWKHKFEKRRTKKRSFYLENGNVASAEMMYTMATMEIGYSDQMNCAALKLPYEGGKMSFVVLLPQVNVSVNNVIANMSKSSLSTLFEEQMIKSKVKLWLPKMSLNWSASLIPHLRTLGINDVFDADRADLTGISDNASRGLFLSDIFQKVVLEVDESGSKAAAATTAIFKQRSLSFAEDFMENLCLLEGRENLQRVCSESRQRTSANIFVAA